MLDMFCALCFSQLAVTEKDKNSKGKSMAVSQWQKNPDLLRKTIEFDFRDNRYRGSLVAPPKSEGPKRVVLVIHTF